MSRLVAAFSLTLLAACASSQARDEVMPPDPMSLQACPPSGEDTFCYPAPLKAAPVVTGAGRVRVLLPDWEPPQRFADPARFLISEASDTGFKTVARGTCPDGSRAESLGQLASGRSTVLCRGLDPVVHIGALTESGSFDWRWKETLKFGDPAQRVGEAPYFVDLGERFALVFSTTGAKGVAAAPWHLQLGPAAREAWPLCRPNEACPIVALVVADGILHVISGVNSYRDVMIGGDGTVVVGDPLLAATVRGGELPAPCVAQARDGKVVLDLPSVRSSAPSGDAPALREASIARLEFKHAWLPHGPHVFPSELATCAPTEFRDDSAAPVPPTFREGVRATFDHGWLLVYGFPAVSPHAWQQAMYPKSSRPTSFPGAVRALRQVTWPGAAPLAATP